MINSSVVQRTAHKVFNLATGVQLSVELPIDITGKGAVSVLWVLLKGENDGKR